MKKIIFTHIAVSMLIFGAIAQEKYQVQMDLTQVTDDRLQVEILVPLISEDSIEYHLPKIVPGTYSISDFGRFIVDLKAWDKDENLLELEKMSINRWKIKESKKLYKITYLIEDSYDEFEGYDNNIIFEPGGVSIEEDKNVFVLNPFGFIGYMEGYKFKPYELTITHPEEIKGATSLVKINETTISDTYTAENYNFLADAPIMYSKPNIVSKNIAGANVLISVYSPNNVLSAQDVMDNIEKLMEAQASYLGGKLPVDRYAYLIYLFDTPTISGGWGALEHSYSSLYTLPERNLEQISQIVKDVAAHEFFHILTPLNIHSEEIHNFNYIEPKMSQHLWLYEGVTEYSSNHVQVKYDLYDLEQFLSEMSDKMNQQEQYNVDIPYTTFSKNILEPKNEQRYGDVYAGGALLAWCLDLTIIKSTNGEKDLPSVLKELSEQYGPLKPFKDDELFTIIEQLTNPQVGRFLKDYVGDTISLPYSGILGWAGIKYEEKRKTKTITSGKFTPALNESQEIYILGIDQMNDFGKKLDFQIGDVLIKWNKKPVNIDTYSDVFDYFYASTKPKDKVTVKVRREVKGKSKIVKLKAKAILVDGYQKHLLEEIKNPSEEQQKIKGYWLGNN